MALLLVLANLLAVISGALLVVLAVTAKPTRGENLMGFHLVTTPLGLAQALAVLLGLCAHGVEPAWLGWLAGLLLPGYGFAMLALPFACFDRRGVTPARAAVLLGVLATFAVVDGPFVTAWASSVGAGLVAVYGGIAVAMAANWWLGPKLRRMVQFHRPAGPDEWQQKQGEWQRGQWQQVPADATAGRLLAFVRAFAPEVKAMSLQRLAALPDLLEQIAHLLRTSATSDAPHYVVQHWPGRRADLAGAMRDHLDLMLADAKQRLRNDRGPNPFLGNYAGSLDAAIAVQQDGGDVHAALQRWHDFLASVPSHRQMAKQLVRYLRVG
jgi:hypothetical protein